MCQFDSAIDTSVNTGINTVIEAKPRKGSGMGKAGKKKIESDKARVDLRLDPEVYAMLMDVAQRTPCSANQLIQAMLRWLLPQAHAGLEWREVFKSVGTRVTGGIAHIPELYLVEQPGCVYFANEDPEEGGTGKVVVQFDFTERRAIVDVPAMKKGVKQDGK